MEDGAGRNRDDLAAYLALAQIPGIGAARLRTLVTAFERAPAVLQAPHGAIAALPGLSRAAATAIRGVTLRAGQHILDTLDRLGATVLLPGEPHFPPMLAEIPDAPAFLYAWGDLTLAEIQHSLSLFVREVMPALGELAPPA